MSAHPSSNPQLPRGLLLCAVASAVLAASLGACAGRPGSTPEAAEPPSDVSVTTCCGDSAMGVALRIASDYRESALATRVFSEDAFWTAAIPMAQYAGFTVRTVAAAPEPVRVITIGQGADTVLIWSQASEGASTGTMALADVLRWFANTRAEDRDDALRARLLTGVTVLLVPLVPESFGTTGTGAGVLSDTFWSALRVSAPLVSLGLVEATGASTPMDSSVATLSVSGSAVSQQVGATLATSLRTELPGRLVHDRAPLSAARHDAVWLASGALPNDPQQQRLRAVHAAAILTLLDGLATGAYRAADTTILTRLPTPPSN